VKTRVLDGWAILEWMNAPAGAGNAVADILTHAETGRARLFMSAITAGEVHYFLRTHHSVSLAEDWRALSRSLPVTIEPPSMEDVWTAAALKGQYPISYTDAFAAGLARKYDCPLMTGNRIFRAVAHLEVDWLAKTAG
jgi:predicted nucleic acid-binding protein